MAVMLRFRQDNILEEEDSSGNTVAENINWTDLNSMSFPSSRLKMPFMVAYFGENRLS